jgi:hypothetical protein
MFSLYQTKEEANQMQPNSNFNKFLCAEAFRSMSYDLRLEKLPSFEYKSSLEFELLPEDIAFMRREASRLAGQATAPELDFCLIKRAPSRDTIKDLVSLDGDATNHDEKLDEEALSHTTAESADMEKLTLIKVAVRMNEENVLKISDYSSDFSQFERLFISNILQIKKGSSVNWDLPNDQFVKEVNNLLSQNRERRKDDRLRFIYKRAIKCLLAQCTDYHSNKSYRMEDFTDQFIRHYFGKKNNINHDVLDTSYASCKKLKLYFGQSMAFKKDFIGLALNKIMDEYKAYTEDQYHKMFSMLKSYLECSKPSDRILLTKFKRIPWSASDIQMSVTLIEDLAR